MKFKIKLNRKIFLKKTTWFVLALFAITMVYIPKLKASAGSSTGTIDADVIKILEIAPGNSYDLTTSSTTNPTTVESYSNGNVKLQVTHMDMAQYNSMIDDVAGLYDAVVISNNLTANSAMNTTDTAYPYHVDLMYRMYSAPNGQGTTVAKYLYSAGSNPDNDPTKYKYYGKTINGSSLVEYYPENDITKKRAQNIVDMVNNGQAVYIDSSITNNSTLSATNLWQIFNGTGIGAGITSKSNYKVVPSTELTLAKLAATLSTNNSNTKRPKVTEVDGPTSETRNSSDGTVTPNRDLQFSVYANAESPQTLTINLYLDFNADGLYSDDEKVKSFQVDGTAANSKYSFDYNLYNSFVGFLNWKVDVVRSNGIKTSTIGNVTMKSLNGKKQINVLQIYPNSDTGTYYNNGNQTSNTRLDKADAYNKNSDFANVLSQVDDYNIKIDSISASDFQKYYGTTKSLTKDFIDGTNCSGTKGYDMVIIGFADSYNNVDISNSNALADLDKFIESNRSVMFTHDTMSLATMSSTSGIQGSTTFTNHYRDIIGQSRYVDPLRTDGKTTNLPYYDSNGVLQAATPIKHDSLPTGVSLGQTPLAINKDQKPGYLQGTRLWESTLTTKIKSVNNAQITQYPFNLTQISGNTAGQVSVSLTHTQWYQLNLEDPDVVPWYNLTSDGTTNRNGVVVGKMDNGDSRNFYYTYSKKNITYSGTGHSGVGDSVQEFELFINTIVKAERGANSAPIVTNMQNDGNNTEIPNGGSISNIEKTNDYTFLTKVDDPDNDKTKVNITADGNSGVTIINASTGATVNQGDFIDNNTLLKVTVPKSIYANKTSTQAFTVSVTGTDTFGAADTKTFNVTTNGNSAPTITNYDNDGQTVIGDGTEVSTQKNADYKFITVPVDTDSDDMNLLSLSVKITKKDGTVIDPSSLSIAGDTFTNGKIVTGSKVQVTVPQSALQDLTPGDNTSYITITTTATDTHTVTATKSFKVYVEAPQPIVSAHGVQIIYNNNDVVETDISTDGSDYNRFIQGSIYSTVTQGTVTPNTTWYSKNFAGILSNLYGKDYTAELKVDSNLKVTSDVLLYKITNGVISDQPNAKMTLNNDGIYTTDFTSQPTDSEKLTGTSYFVTYTAELKAMPANGKSFINSLSVNFKGKIENPGNMDCTTTFEKITEDNDLF